MIDKEELKKFIQEAIEEKVNGKIDNIKEQLTAHTKEIEPYLEGLRAGKFLAKVIVWTCGFIATVGGAFLIIKKLF